MKCPVCDSKIPLGQDRCPNCGMIIKADKSSIQTSQPVYHQTKQNNNQKNINDLIKQVKNRPSTKRKALVGGWNMILVIILILFVIRLIFGFVFNFDSHIEYDSLNEAIEHIEDDGTISKVLEIKDSIESILSQPTYDYCISEENVVASEDVITVTTQLYSTYESWCDIEVYIQAENNVIIHYTIQYSGFHSGRGSANGAPVKKEAVDCLMDELGHVNAYEQYEEVRKKLYKTGASYYDNYWEESYEHYNLAVSETYETAYDQTNYQLLYVMK